MSNNFAAVFRTRLPLHPGSFPGLVLVGLLLVALPLAIPVVYSAVSINQLSKQSRQAVYQAKRIADYGRTLTDQAAAMERSVRLASILADASLLRGYYQGHEKFRETLHELSALPLLAEQSQLMQTMDASEAAIFRRVEKSSRARDGLAGRAIDFAALKNSLDAFLSHGDAVSEMEVEAIQAQADRANDVIFWMLAGLAPCAILLAFGFAVLIARPIRQIDQAIRAMGDGKLTGDIRIVGPQDLQQLGERLNWMRQRLLEIENQKTTFIRHVSHELKTPLTSIREGANLLSEGIAGKLTPEQNEIAEILFSNSIQLQKRIEDLLSFSELQAGKAVLVTREVALRTILERVVNDQRLAVAGKSLRIELECPADLSLECDAQKVGIIVDNLLSNAVKYSPPSGIIRIRAERGDGVVRLDVVDRGAGIDPMDKGRIFDAFYQGRRAPQGHTRGTGLGLAIAREYALAHGGTLDLVDDEPAGGEAGARFRLTLPMNHAASAT